MNDLPPNWHILEETTSTNDTIHQAALAGEPEGTVHIARSQTSGRGRAGRSWWSPPGSGLWMTVLLRPRLPESRTAGLSLVAGRAVTEALQPLLQQRLSVYWPNDLYLGPERKLGGILCELHSRARTYWIGLGIGVNIDLREAEIPATLSGKVASLAEAGCTELQQVPLAKRILTAFWPLYHRFQSGIEVAEIVGDSLAHLGRAVTVQDGARTPLRGRVTGLGRRGQLLVRDACGTIHEVIAGDVSYESV